MLTRTVSSKKAASKPKIEPKSESKINIEAINDVIKPKPPIEQKTSETLIMEHKVIFDVSIQNLRELLLINAEQTENKSEESKYMQIQSTYKTAAFAKSAIDLIVTLDNAPISCTYYHRMQSNEKINENEFKKHCNNEMLEIEELMKQCKIRIR